MSFTPNIPASGQTLGNSRLQVLNNFATLRTTISNVTQPNHIDVNNVGAGKHIFVQMPVQTPGAANLPAANEGGMITRTLAGNSELYYVRDAVNTYIQMTGPSSIVASGYTTVFGGLIIQWGLISVNTSGTIEVFPIPFPNAALSVSFGPVAASGQETVNLTAALSTTQMNLRASAAFATYYIAIGH